LGLCQATPAGSPSTGSRLQHALRAIGLVLHELATNIGKYGALSTDRGPSMCAGDRRRTLTMSWTERRGPHVSAPAEYSEWKAVKSSASLALALSSSTPTRVIIGEQSPVMSELRTQHR
jgi:hypothetical protein